MGQATVRISERTRAVLREIEEYRRKRFIEDLNASYAELRNDPEAWKAVETERALWDGTLMDGLPEDEIWDPESRTASFVKRRESA